MNQTPHIDDEQKRKFYKTFARYWVNQSIDDLKLVDGKILFKLFLAVLNKKNTTKHFFR